MPAKKSISKMKRKSGNGKLAAAKSSAKKAPAKLAAIKLPSVYKDRLSKSATVKAITDATGSSKKVVTSVLECFAQVIEKHVKPGGAGNFVLPGLLKINVVKKAARPARKGINPFNGEEMIFKAKPACKVVRIKALKKLKEMVA
jgi:nucleoid DNA-binding protein